MLLALLLLRCFFEAFVEVAVSFAVMWLLFCWFGLRCWFVCLLGWVGVALVDAVCLVVFGVLFNVVFVWLLGLIWLCLFGLFGWLGCVC